jgi:two-component system cell cycle response regulator
VVTTVVGILLEVRHQYLAGVDPGAMGASAILLTLTAVGCGYARRRVMDLITRLSAIATEEQAMRDLAQKTREQSYLDALTGLYNRRGFLTLGEQQLAAAARTGVHYVIVFMDLDGLKTINDELGHAVGDEAIREAATVLRQTLRDADLVARLGGDEFVALAADSLETSRGGGRIIERISERLRTFNDGGHRPYKLQMSAGAVSFDPARPRALEALMVDADTAMYAQKKTRPSHRNAPVLASA